MVICFCFMDYLTFLGGYAIMNQRQTKQNTNLMGVCVYVNRTENLRNGTVVSNPEPGKKQKATVPMRTPISPRQSLLNGRMHKGCEKSIS